MTGRNGVSLRERWSIFAKVHGFGSTEHRATLSSVSPLVFVVLLNHTYGYDARVDRFRLISFPAGDGPGQDRLRSRVRAVLPKAKAYSQQRDQYDYLILTSARLFHRSTLLPWELKLYITSGEAVDRWFVYTSALKIMPCGGWQSVAIPW